VTESNLEPILRDLRDDFRAHKEDVAVIRDSVTKQVVLMETLIAPGGRIPRIENDVEDLKEYKVKAAATIKTTATFWGAVAAAAGVVGHFLTDWLHSGAKH